MSQIRYMLVSFSVVCADYVCSGCVVSLLWLPWMLLLTNLAAFPCFRISTGRWCGSWWAAA